MATKGGKGGKHPQDAIDSGRAAAGSGTATGQEANRRAGNETASKGKERGSTVKSTIPVQKAGDYLGKGQPPIGKQKEPATFVGNGQINTGMVGSPSGPVPIASVVSTPEEGVKLEAANIKTLAEQNKKLTRGRRLTDLEISRMSAAELRAVSTDRAYGAIPGQPGFGISSMAGTRGTRAAFTEFQKNDKYLEK